MLQSSTQRSYEYQKVALGKERGADEYFDLGYIVKSLRRQLKLIIALALIGGIFGFVHVATSVRLYTTTVSLIIDRRQVRAVQDVSATTDVGVATPAIVDSQVQVLKSPRIALAVVDRLSLTNDAIFWAPDGSIWTEIYRWFGRNVRHVVDLILHQPAAVQDEARRQEMRRLNAAFRLLGRITNARVGQTYVVTLTYEGTDADQAVHIANTYVDAYLADQNESGYEATRRANSWLQKRLNELRQLSITSDQAVQEFRAANNLIAVGGQLISELQLAELNSQLSVARADVARAAARFDRVRAVLGEDKSQDTAQPEKLFETLIAEATGTPASDFHAQYFEASRREAEIIARFGPDHERAARYRAEKTSIRQQVVAELARIAGSYNSEYQVAKRRLEELNRNVDNLIQIAAGANDKMVKLRELEQTADTYKRLYRSFLERYQQTVQQQSFPMNDARIVAPAVPPMLPSYPKTVPVILLSALMGGIVGGVYGVLREYRDRSFRTRSQVREELGLKCLGMLPTISSFQPIKKRSWNPWRKIVPVSRQGDLPALMRYAVNKPQSIFSESLRMIAASTDYECPAQGSKIIGVLSVAQEEGKSLVAANLAALLASEGAKTLLVDADLKNPTISKVLAPNALDGLLEVLAASQSWSAAVCRVANSEMLLIPTVSRPGSTRLSRTFMHDRFGKALHDASKCFEYVIVDLPRLGAGGNSNFLAGMVDCILLVVEWGRTPKELVKDMLASNETVANRCIGVILDRVDLNRLRLYENHVEDSEAALLS